MSTNTSSFRCVTYIILALSCPLLAQTGGFAGGTGQPDDPYQIATAQQFIILYSRPALFDGHFILVNDIDLDPNLPGGRTFNEGVIAAGPTPSRHPFSGSFNGAGHTIRNLVIHAKSPQGRSTPVDAMGLFGCIGPSGLVKDLRIEVADVQVLTSRAGVLAGENDGRVINCTVSGRVSSNTQSLTAGEVGGLVGRNTGDIVNCRADMELVSAPRTVGGLAGANFPEARIVGCRAACQQVSAGDYGAGGLVGINSGTIAGSYATGGILACESSYHQGGLVGSNRGTILNCHADIDITAGPQCKLLGGLAGSNLGTIINGHARGSISTQDQCRAIGGLVGWNGDVPAGTSGFVVNSYAATKIFLGAGNWTVGGLIGHDTEGEMKMSFWDTETSGLTTSAGGQGLTTAQMQHAGTFLEAGWDFVGERTNGVTDAWRMPADGGYPVLTLGFDGYTPPRLAGEGTAEAPYQIATPDDLGMAWRHDPSACYLLTSNIDLVGIPWQGAPIASFSGLFDGGGCVIYHLTLHERGTAGLFGFLGSNALVMDLGVADANLVAPEGARDLGVLAGRSHYDSDVTRCYATGRLSAGRRSFALGGLIGRNYSVVADCYAKVDLSCGPKSGQLGGLLGYNHGAAIHSYTAGAVVTPDPNATCGGLVGTTLGTLTVNNCYFLASSDGGGPNNGLGVPLTDARMKQQASFTFWDFKDTWAICAGKDYPRLRWERIDCDQP